MTTTNAMTTTKVVRSMAQAIKIVGDDTIHGGDTSREHLEAVAREWVAAGFDAASAFAWWNVRAFDAAVTGALRDAGITPEMAGERGHDRECWAYAASNGDVSVSEAIRVLNFNVDADDVVHVGGVDLDGVRGNWWCRECDLAECQKAYGEGDDRPVVERGDRDYQAMTKANAVFVAI